MLSEFIIRIFVGVIFLIHAFAHLVGFVVPWRLMKNPEAAYKTTLLAGRIDVGDLGMRAVGILWLVAAITFAVAGARLMALRPWWHTLALIAALFSLLMSVAGWPETRIGVFINVAILGFLVLASRTGWLM